MEIDYNHPGEWASRAGQVKYDASPAGSSLLPGSPGDRCCGSPSGSGHLVLARPAVQLHTSASSSGLFRKVFEMETFHFRLDCLSGRCPLIPSRCLSEELGTGSERYDGLAQTAQGLPVGSIFPWRVFFPVRVFSSESIFPWRAFSRGSIFRRGHPGLAGAPAFQAHGPWPCFACSSTKDPCHVFWVKTCHLSSGRCCVGAASLAARPRRGLVAGVGRAASGPTTVELPLTRFPVLPPR